MIIDVKASKVVPRETDYLPVEHRFHVYYLTPRSRQRSLLENRINRHVSQVLRIHMFNGGLPLNKPWRRPGVLQQYLYCTPTNFRGLYLNFEKHYLLSQIFEKSPGKLTVSSLFNYPQFPRG
jgi:hypothetical protein